MIAVIDYGVGNLFSVEKALMQFATDVLITGDKELIAKADKLVLPGVGDFGECMSNLEATGLIPTIRECIAKGTPLLGICIGEQILFEGSEESPEAKGLGHCFISSFRSEKHNHLLVQGRHHVRTTCPRR